MKTFWPSAVALALAVLLAIHSRTATALPIGGCRQNLIAAVVVSTMRLRLASVASTAAFLTSGPLRVSAFTAARAVSTSAPVCTTAKQDRAATAISTITRATMAPASSSSKIISGPAWDLSDEYSSVDAPELVADIDASVDAMDRMAEHAAIIAPHLETARNMSVADARSLGILDALDAVNSLKWSSSAALRDVYIFANCLGSVDGKNEAAKRLTAKIGELFSKHSQAAQPASLFLTLCTDEVADAFLAMSKDAKDTTFVLAQSRKKRDNTLSLAEENMLSSYSVPGISAWGSLYTDLSATLVVNLEQEDGSIKKMGIAGAAGLLDSPDGETRRRAWQGIKNAWLPHVETCAAILNGMLLQRIRRNARIHLAPFLVSNPALT
jgi:Oligopeptidase F